MPIDPDQRPSPPAGVDPALTKKAADHRRFPSVGRAVLEGVRRFEPEALGIFFDTYFDRIYQLAYSLLGTRMQAEDAAQEVCYRIQRSAHKLDPDRDPAAWVMVTTLNTCRSFWRSSSYRLERASQSLDGATPGGPEVVANTPGPEAALLAGERQRLVRQAIHELEAPLREVVILHAYQGLDHKEVASVLGLSHEAARKRYSRALTGLARRLKGILHDDGR